LTRNDFLPVSDLEEVRLETTASDSEPATAADRGEATLATVVTARRLAGTRDWLLRRFRNSRVLFRATEDQWHALEMRVKARIGRIHACIAQLPRRLYRSTHQMILVSGRLFLLPPRLIRPLCRLLHIDLGFFFNDPDVRRDYLRHLAVRFRPARAQQLYWTLNSNILDIYACAQQVEADIWLANDWNMLPIAARLAAEKGGVYGYDTHEFAAEEYAEKWRWRLWQKPLVCALERQFIGGAAVVSVVSGGIAERLGAMYGLKRPTLVIRNTPNYERCSFRPAGAQIHVLYHGIVAVGRGLEAAIDSAVLWRPEFDLTIRGPENPGFSDKLRQRICEAGLDGRVRLVPPVPMTELVSEATAFDIGFFALPGHSRHNEFALPNKFFEYVMAGLALCVSDLPEMARLVRQYRLGVLIPSLEPAAIAAAINGLDRERIDAWKRNALAAAEELCWERESARMVEAYGKLLPQTAAAG
jgi:glycosyltransferase involved in cell wall biosynthesis